MCKPTGEAVLPAECPRGGDCSGCLIRMATAPGEAIGEPLDAPERMQPPALNIPPSGRPIRMRPALPAF